MINFRYRKVNMWYSRKNIIFLIPITACAYNKKKMFKATYYIYFENYDLFSILFWQQIWSLNFYVNYLAICFGNVFLMNYYNLTTFCKGEEHGTHNCLAPF